ncbi:Protein kinase-like domain-containing protein [Cynara cardunculus var. scolymus]|uniref:Serine/threonine-protein kinase RIO1 n=1 Tax=Cynara cardunculus var. scolymus TaxID=59895 RepID=A0A118JY72_CYNCS|nr:Protein kinase-like domain-containing protein [Cynara cardunculus var. scolymus]
MSIVVEKSDMEESKNEIGDQEEVLEDEEDISWSSDSEIGEALDYLDSKDDTGAVDGALILNARRPNAHGGIRSRPNASPLQPLSNRNQKFTNHIRASGKEGGMLACQTPSPLQSVKACAIDPRTRMVLFKMLNRGIFHDINGCISTGKEANVYHATRSDGQELAIKVYKTSVLVFKDRDRYVQGDYRFRYGYCKHNPRKMVKTWAEKEMRNLMRLKTAGIRCPTPILLRLHVLVMEFIDDNYNAGTISKGHMYVIDVSQSVDLDHPHALDFLREDCVHLFDFIVDPAINDDSVDAYLEEAQQKILARGDEISVEDEIADAVFVQSFIPKTLDNVKNAEEDVIRLTSGQDTGDMYYQTITGLKHALSIEQQQHHEANLQQDSPADPKEPSDLQDHESETETDEENSEDSEDDTSSSDDGKPTPLEKKAARKENKKKVKEEKREARKTKVPKALKKKKKKLAKAKKYR